MAHMLNNIFIQGLNVLIAIIFLFVVLVILGSVIMVLCIYSSIIYTIIKDKFKAIKKIS